MMDYRLPVWLMTSMLIDLSPLSFLPSRHPAARQRSYSSNDIATSRSPNQMQHELQAECVGGGGGVEVLELLRGASSS